MLVCIHVVVFQFVASFSPRQNLVSRRTLPSTMLRASSFRLFGISEWRDQSTGDLHHSSRIHDGISRRIRKVPLHLLSSKQVALPGEIVYLQFTRDDEVLLFQQAVDNHQGIFGLGFISEDDDILYEKISLAEIQDYNMMGGAFGIFLSVQVVGLAEIVETECSDEKSLGSVSESRMKGQEDKETFVVLCNEIMNRREHMGLVEASDLGRSVEKLIAEVCIAENQLRMPVDSDQNRWDRYREAYYLAFEADTQGYTYSAGDTSSECCASSLDDETIYTWKGLNAISWAAFSTSESLQQDATYRLAALDNDCITNRLLLATYWLSDLLLEVVQEASH